MAISMFQKSLTLPLIFCFGIMNHTVLNEKSKKSIYLTYLLSNAIKKEMFKKMNW